MSASEEERLNSAGRPILPRVRPENATEIQLAKLPPRLLTILYFSASHIFLAAAFAALALWPRELVGFYYHAKMVAVVHLVTLGWITMSILGALYVAGPMAMKIRMKATLWDYAAFALMVLGTAGMAGSFWSARYGFLGPAAAGVVAAITMVGARVIPGLSRAGIHGAVKLHIFLAFTNILVAGTMGFLLALDKERGFLPGGGLGNVYAHAHLAAVGWAMMMVMGVGYRLFPMVLPSAMPSGKSLYAGAIFLEIGALGLFLFLLTGNSLLTIPAMAVGFSLALFLGHLIWMKKNARRSPAGLPRPDFGTGQAISAIIYLCIASILGLFLAMAPMFEWTLKLATVYGIAGLLGFLGQIIAGIAYRLLPLMAAAHAIVRTGADGPFPRPHELPSKNVQMAAFAFWTAGIPGVTAGLWLESTTILSLSALLLLAAAILGGINTFLVLRRAYI
jgi:hypothetical protein